MSLQNWCDRLTNFEAWLQSMDMKDRIDSEFEDYAEFEEYTILENMQFYDEVLEDV